MKTNEKDSTKGTEKPPAKKLWVWFLLLFFAGVLWAVLFHYRLKPEQIKPIVTKPNYGQKLAEAYSYIYTTKREFALTFNGLGDRELIFKLLDQLDEAQMKATFFLPGIRVAEEPELAREIHSRGHILGNNTLHRQELVGLPLEKIQREIERTNELIEWAIGVKPRYLRTKSGEFNDDVRKVAAYCGLDGVVSYSINPQDWDRKDALAIGAYVRRYLTRGGVIMLNTDRNPEVVAAIPLIAEAAQDIGYKAVTLPELIAGGYQRKSYQQIPGHDRVQVNLNAQNPKYRLLRSFKTQKKVVALTFDDWGDDYSITKILDALAAYDVKATFFLRANGVEMNPNLAKAISEQGHEIANHTYSHPVITKVSADEVQKEVVKCHRVLTEAIQHEPTLYFRPPTGEINEKAAKAIASSGYADIVLYDLSPQDWNPNKTREEIINYVFRNVRPGSVILLHLTDGLPTPHILPTILAGLQTRGYQFITMSEAFGH